MYLSFYNYKYLILFVILFQYEIESNDILPAEPSSIVEMVSKIVVSSAVSGDVYTCVATSGIKEKSASTTVYTLEGKSHNTYRKDSVI